MVVDGKDEQVPTVTAARAQNEEQLRVVKQSGKSFEGNIAGTEFIAVVSVKVDCAPARLAIGISRVETDTCWTLCRSSDGIPRPGNSFDRARLERLFVFGPAGLLVH